MLKQHKTETLTDTKITEFVPRSSKSPRPPAAEIVITEATHRPEFLELVRNRQLHAEERGQFRTFYSRKASVRFARPHARWGDWKAAFHQRSLESLKSEFRYYLVSRTAE